MKSFVRRFIKPIFFSEESENIKTPYLYGFLLMVFFFASVFIFLDMALSNKFSAGVLGCVATVIATLAGLYAIVVGQYNKGKGNKIQGPEDGRWKK